MPARKARAAVRSRTGAEKSGPGWEFAFFRQGKSRASSLCCLTAGAARQRWKLGEKALAALRQRERRRLVRRGRSQGRYEQRSHPFLRACPARPRREIDEQRRVQRPRGQIQRELSSQLQRKLEGASCQGGRRLRAFAGAARTARAVSGRAGV